MSEYVNNNDFYTEFTDLNDSVNDKIRGDIARWLYSIKFDSYAYIIVPQNDCDNFYILNGFNPLWKKQYTECQFHKIDPIIAKAKDYQCPNIWSSVTLSVDDRFLNCAKNHGVRYGYSVSLPVNEKYIGVLSIARKDDAFISRSDSINIIGMMTIYIQELNSASRDFINGETNNHLIKPVLTLRERECLKWLAEGKTNWEISKILSISERTVIFHISNCMNKLEANNRVQVIVNAMRAKVIK